MSARILSVRFLAGVFAVFLASARPAAAAAECECTIGFFENKAEHLAAWSNMLGQVELASTFVKAAEAAAQDAERYLDDLEKSAPLFREAVKELDVALEKGGRIKRQLGPSYLEPGKEETLKRVVDQIEGVRKGVEDGLKKKRDAEQALKMQSFDSISRAANAALDGFEGVQGDARSIWGRASEQACVAKEFENIKAAHTAIKTAKKVVDDCARTVSAKRIALEGDIRVASERESDAIALPGQMAEALRLEGISDFDSLLEKLAKLIRPRHTVEFYDFDRRLLGTETLFEGECVKEPSEQPDPQGDREFLGWKDRSKPFEDDPRDALYSFDTPVTTDLKLDQVWVYAISLVSQDKTWSAVREISASGRPTLRKILESEPVRQFERDHENQLHAAGRKRPDGWWNVDTGNPVSSGTPVLSSMTIEFRDKDIEYPVEWIDANGTILRQQNVKAGETPPSPELPASTKDYKYLHWSAEENGDPFGARMVDAPLRLYAVRTRLENNEVRFFDEDGKTKLGEGVFGDDDFEELVREGDERIPKEPDKAGRRFVGWALAGADVPFSGRLSGKTKKLVALYRDASVSERIDSFFKEWRDRFPLGVVVGADALLLVLFVYLLATGPKKPRAPAGKGPGAGGGEPQDSGAAEPPPLQPVVAGVFFLLAPTLAAAAQPVASSPFATPPFDPASLLYPGLLLVGAVLAALDAWLLLCRFGRFAKRAILAVARLFAPRRADADPHGHGDSGDVPEKEVCPTCGLDLVDGECPNGCTIVRCAKCNAITRDGVCPHCGLSGEGELCPTCGSELEDGECPRGHTIVRCPDCGSILSEGHCPKGCDADPLNLGWPGGAEKKLSGFALRVVACPKSEGEGFALPVPPSFIVGRSSEACKEPFVELLTTTRKEKSQCSRQYVRLDLDEAIGAFKVTLLNASKNPAFVNGEKLVMQNASAPLALGGRLKLNPKYELELVEMAAEG